MSVALAVTSHRSFLRYDAKAEAGPLTSPVKLRIYVMNCHASAGLYTKSLRSVVSISVTRYNKGSCTLGDR